MTARAVVELTGAFEDEYVASLPGDTDEIVLDLDSTEDPTHGQQPLSFFNAHYDSYMYFPLLVFGGECPLAGFRLRPGNAGNNRYATPLMVRLVRKLKARFPNARILIRADAGFCVPRFLDALERLDRELTHVRYVIGVQKNSRLVGLAHAPMPDAAREAHATRPTTRRFDTFQDPSRTSTHQPCIASKP